MKQFIKCSHCGDIKLITRSSSTGDQYHHCLECGFLNIEKDGNLESLKALSIKQPWATFIIDGHKDIENRDTLKNFRGTFLIHAGVNIDKDWRQLNHDKSKVPHILNYNTMDRGGIIGHAEIYDCVTESDSPWFVGKNGLMLRNAKPLPFIPCKGKLSFFYPEID